MKVKITGMKYAEVLSGEYFGFSANGKKYAWLAYLDGRPGKVKIYSQFGWEDGGRKRDVRTITNPKFVSGSFGDACTLSNITLSCDSVE
jgi:hypothetical protein